MIKEIRLANFFSIKEEIVLDLQAANMHSAKARMLDKNVFANNKMQYLKSLAIYGANASGKTNIIKTINFCVKMIVSSHTHNENVVFNFQPYKFDGWDTKPSSFFVRFVCDGIDYEYSFSLTTTEIISEALFYYPNGRRTMVFERNERNGSKIKDVYKFSTTVKRPFDVANNTSRKTLFLSRASNLGREWAQKIYRFFNEELLFELNYSVSKNDIELIKKDILHALQVADFDIIDFDVETILVPSETVSFSIGAAQNTELIRKQEMVPQLVIKTYHKPNPTIPFNLMAEESEGTKKMFYLIIALTEIVKSGKTLFLDEIEKSLHPILVKYIISMFHNSERAQLVFTTHNTNLLNLDDIRKDQIYFVNKLTGGESELYSLFDYKDFRESMDVEKAYLQGRFDAIPVINQ